MSGIVEDLGPGISEFRHGDEVYGVTNPQFCGANAEYAIASSKMISSKPHRLSFAEAASVPVIAVTAWQMLFDHGSATANQTALILGAAGNVGAYAVQLAVRAGLHVIGIVGSHDVAFAKGLGCDKIIDYKSERFEGSVHDVDLVIDTVGGDGRDRAINVIKPGGVLVSSVGAGSVLPHLPGIRSVFFYVEVTSDRLNAISQLFDTGELVPNVDTVLRLEDIRSAHEMLPARRAKVERSFCNRERAATESG